MFFPLFLLIYSASSSAESSLDGDVPMHHASLLCRFVPEGRRAGAFRSPPWRRLAATYVHDEWLRVVGVRGILLLCC